MSEKEAEIRASLQRLDEAVSASGSGSLTAEDLAMLRRQLEESGILVREQHDKAKQVHEENEILTRRKDELEARLTTLEAEYEELLGECFLERERVAHRSLIRLATVHRQSDSRRRESQQQPIC